MYYRKVTRKLKQFADEKRISSNKEGASVKDVAQMVKKMPQYQKELNNYATHMHLAEDCMREYQAKIAKLCKVEQAYIILYHRYISTLAFNPQAVNDD